MHLSPATADAPVRSIVPLTQLGRGAVTTLHDARVDADTRSLLRALGLTDACRLRLCKHGEPCIVQVRSTRIGVSQEVARCIFVLVDEASPR